MGFFCEHSKPSISPRDHDCTGGPHLQVCWIQPGPPAQLVRIPDHGDPQYNFLRPLGLLASIIKIVDVGPRMRRRLQVYQATRAPRLPRDDSPPPKWHHMDGDDPTQDGEDEAETGE